MLATVFLDAALDSDPERLMSEESPEALAAHRLSDHDTQLADVTRTARGAQGE